MHEAWRKHGTNHTPTKAPKPGANFRVAVLWGRGGGDGSLEFTTLAWPPLSDLREAIFLRPLFLPFGDRVLEDRITVQMERILELEHARAAEKAVASVTGVVEHLGPQREVPCRRAEGALDGTCGVH